MAKNGSDSLSNNNHVESLEPLPPEEQSCRERICFIAMSITLLMIIIVLILHAAGVITVP